MRRFIYIRSYAPLLSHANNTGTLVLMLTSRHQSYGPISPGHAGFILRTIKWITILVMVHQNQVGKTESNRRISFSVWCVHADASTTELLPIPLNKSPNSTDFASTTYSLVNLREIQPYRHKGMIY